MVYVFLADGFEEIEALTQVDYLRRAGIDVKTCGIGKMLVVGSKRIGVQADMPLEDVTLDNADMLILPGGLGGVKGISESARAMQLIREAYAKGIRISAICAAPTILAKLGLLKGKKCVCYPDMLCELEKGGAVVCADSAVVCDGLFITAKAAGASEEFAFAIIETLKSKAAALNVKESICAR